MRTRINVRARILEDLTKLLQIADLRTDYLVHCEQVDNPVLHFVAFSLVKYFRIWIETLAGDRANDPATEHFHNLLI